MVLVVFCIAGLKKKQKKRVSPFGRVLSSDVSCARIDHVLMVKVVFLTHITFLEGESLFGRQKVISRALCLFGRMRPASLRKDATMIDWNLSYME